MIQDIEIQNFLQMMWDVICKKLINNLQEMREPVSYSLFPAGKCLRSLLLLHTGLSLNLDKDRLVSVAASIECLHTYTIIHDDLPCVDNGLLRRGKPSCWRAYGEDVALLVGDGLFSFSLQLISEEEILPLSTRVDLMGELLRVVGFNGWAKGQYIDVKELCQSFDDVINMCFLKTGSIFGFCMYTPAKISGLSNDDCKEFSEIGIKFGVLCQVIDDLMDRSCSTLEVGKDTHKDSMKKNLIFHMGFEKSLEWANKSFEELQNDLVNIFGKNSSVGKFAKIVLQTMLNKVLNKKYTHST